MIGTNNCLHICDVFSVHLHFEISRYSPNIERVDPQSVI